MTRIRAALLATATLLLAGGAPAGATVIVRAEASAASVAVGDAFTLELRADVSDPVVGFGLDLPFDPALLEILGAPTIGPLWLGAFAPDGDGLAGLAPGAGISGGDLLLTTLVLRALAPGEATLVTTFTAGDLTEGFPLDPAGFEADVQHVPVQVMLVPEPGAPWLALALALGVSWGRIRRPDRRLDAVGPRPAGGGARRISAAAALARRAGLSGPAQPPEPAGQRRVDPAETWKAIHRVLIGFAREKRIERGGTIRGYTTVVDAAIHEPSRASITPASGPNSPTLPNRVALRAAARRSHGALSWKFFRVRCETCLR